MRVRSIRRGGVLLLACALLTTGCGSSTETDPAPEPERDADDPSADDQGRTDEPDDTVAPDEPEEKVGLPAGSVGVYLAFTVSSDRSVFNDASTGPIVLESSQQAVAMFNLDALSAGIIDSTSSKNYAKSHLRPHTFEGRLVIVDELDGDSFYYQEYDPRSGTPVGVESKVGGDSIYTFSGSSIFDVRVIDRLGAPNEVVLRRTDIDSGDSTDLGDFVLGAGGQLLGWDGRLFHVNHVRGDEPLRLHHVPLDAIGNPELMVEGAVERDATEISGSWMSPTVSDGSVHWLEAIDLGGSARIQVWSYDLVANDGEFRNPVSIEVPIADITSLSLWDIDGTVLAIALRTADDTDHLLVHDWSTDTTETHSLDIAPFELAVLAS